MTDYPFNDISWQKRSKMIAGEIPASSTVVDLGGGDEHILQHLKTPVAYFPIDKFKRTDRTIVADFNKGEFPDILPRAFGKEVFIVAAGVIEYLEKPDEFLKRVRKYGDKLIVSYLENVGSPRMDRPHSMTMVEVMSALHDAGWDVEFQREISPRHRIFFCNLHL